MARVTCGFLLDNAGRSITFTFASPIWAFGFDLKAQTATLNATIAYAANGSPAGSYNLPSIDATEFRGFVSSTPFTVFTLTTSATDTRHGMADIRGPSSNSSRNCPNGSAPRCMRLPCWTPTTGFLFAPAIRIGGPDLSKEDPRRAKVPGNEDSGKAVVERRPETLRDHAWSSWRVYSGVEAAPFCRRTAA